jgi:hypothetical protein
MSFVVPPERERMAGYGRFETVIDALDAVVSGVEYVVGRVSRPPMSIRPPASASACSSA